MWDFRNTKKVKELKIKVFQLEMALEQAKELERLCDERFTKFVKKHDEELLKTKANG